MEGECEMGDIEIVKEKPIEILISEIQNLRQELYNIKNDVSFIKHYINILNKEKEIAQIKDLQESQNGWHIWRR
jgi:hypothetical protein|tara:strand:- start:1527 stop:1748 length:222 start_codon:yes stop_codon:yes gene_type:complete